MARLMSLRRSKRIANKQCFQNAMKMCMSRPVFLKTFQFVTHMNVPSRTTEKKAQNVINVHTCH